MLSHGRCPVGLAFILLLAGQEVALVSAVREESELQMLAEDLAKDDARTMLNASEVPEGDEDCKAVGIYGFRKCEPEEFCESGRIYGCRVRLPYWKDDRLAAKFGSHSGTFLERSEAYRGSANSATALVRLYGLKDDASAMGECELALESIRPDNKEKAKECKKNFKEMKIKDYYLHLSNLVADAITEPPGRPGSSMADFYSAKVAISVVIYFLSVSAVPIFNKKVFSGGVHVNGVTLKKYPYPIATAFLQLGLVAVLLGLANIVGHFVQRRRTAEGTSWLFGPHLGYKIWHVAPCGVLFGFKYGLTNWGLSLMPTGTHLLLQSTDLIWTMATAWLWNKERLSASELFAAFLATVGSVLIGLHAGQTLDAPLVPLVVNCCTPLVLALCISTLRSGTKELFRPDNRLGGSMSPAEFTSLKLILSSAMALLLSLALENGAVSLTKANHVAWWTALQHEPFLGVVFLLVGGLIVLVYQVNITWLSGLTSAATVGIVGGVKVVPQWLMNAAFLGKYVDFSVLNMLGAALVLCASCLYTVARWRRPHEESSPRSHPARDAALPLRSPSALEVDEENK